MGNAKKLTDQFWALFEADRIPDAAELVHPDCHFKMPGMELRGRAALIEMLSAYRTAFPDLKHRVIDHVETNDTIAIELLVEGTHTGPMQTPAGTVPATGRKVVWESCDYVQIKQGKLSSWHVYHDSVPFLTALGVLPPPAAG